MKTTEIANQQGNDNYYQILEEDDGSEESIGDEDDYLNDSRSDDNISIYGVSQSNDNMHKESEATKKMVEFFQEESITRAIENKTLNKLLNKMEYEYRQ